MKRHSNPYAEAINKALEDNLTLHQRISIKGALAPMGVPGSILVRLRSFKDFMFHWYTCFRRPMSQFFKHHRIGKRK